MSLYARLCGWRLRQLAAATFRLLVRRWHATVFLLLLLSPTDMPFAEQLQLLATPVLQVVQAGHAAQSVAVWATLLLLAWAWSALQGQAVVGGEAWDHLGSMPIAPRLLLLVDLTVLAIADLPLWLPIVAALVWLALQRTGTGGSIAAVLALAGQIPVVQCLALRRRRRGLAYCLLGSCAGFAAMGASGQPWLWCAATLLGLAAGLACKPPGNARAARPVRQPWLALRSHWRPSAQLAAITVRSLLGPGALGRHFGLLLTAVMPPALFAFVQHGGVQAAVMTVALLLLLPPLLFRVAALALDLKRLHLPMERMHASLGISTGTLLRMSLLVLSAVFAMLSLPLVLTLWYATGAPTALLMVPIGMAAMAAMAWLDRTGERGRFVTRVVLAALACWAVYALL